ncbi:hypothetical protein NKG05_07450 [Oerskovia sp. M15]
MILTVGLGLGTQKDVSEQISALGSNLLIVTPGSSTDSDGMRGASARVRRSRAPTPTRWPRTSTRPTSPGSPREDVVVVRRDERDQLDNPGHRHDRGLD